MRFKFAVGAFSVHPARRANSGACANEPRLSAGFTSKDANVDGLKLHYTWVDMVQR